MDASTDLDAPMRDIHRKSILRFLDTSVDIDTEIEREHRDHILYQCNPKCVSGHIC